MLSNLILEEHVHSLSYTSCPVFTCVFLRLLPIDFYNILEHNRHLTKMRKCSGNEMQTELPITIDNDTVGQRDNVCLCKEK